MINEAEKSWNVFIKVRKQKPIRSGREQSHKEGDQTKTSQKGHHFQGSVGVKGMMGGHQFMRQNFEGSDVEESAASDGLNF